MVPEEILQQDHRGQSGEDVQGHEIVDTGEPAHVPAQGRHQQRHEQAREHHGHPGERETQHGRQQVTQILRVLLICGSRNLMVR